MDPKSSELSFVFFGSTHVSVAMLQGFIDKGFVPKLVVTTKDKPVGRKQVMTQSPVKSLASKHGIEVITPDNLRDTEQTKVLESGWDLFLVTSYPLIIPQRVIDMPSHGIVNVHFSLLPLLRGGSPVRTAIVDGHEETGTTVFLMDSKLDHGPVLAQGGITEVSGKRYRELEGELIESSLDMVCDVIPKLVAETIEATPQDHSKKTYAPMFTKDSYKIDPKLLSKGGTPEELAAGVRQLLAFDPDPGVWTILDTDKGSVRIKIKDAHQSGARLVPNTVVPEGKNEMPWDDFLRGNNLLTQ